jgi:outer membrane protein TolC
MKHPVLMGGVLALLSACASPPGPAPAAAPPLDHPANAALGQNLVDPPPLPWPGQTDEAQSTAAIQALLAQPLTQEAAVRVTVLGSPALRALVAQSEAQAARSRAQSRPGLLSLSLERLRRGDETEIGRSLSIGLLDLLTWPWRSQAADRQITAQQQQLARQVMGQVQAVRAQWVKAVAAQQRLAYQGDVLLASQTSAELARRMQAAGHFSSAQATQQALMAAEAQQTQTQAQAQALSEREALLRLLGLSGHAALTLQLPDRLPSVPGTPPRTSASVAEAARTQGLGTRLAEAQWQASRSASRDTSARSLIDLEAGWQRNSSNAAPVQQGPDLTLRLASIDFGAARRQASRLEEQAALAQYQQATLAAESTLRERWAAYLAAHETARHATEVLQPLRQRLLGERLKQYNGMLIGPLDLLAEARAHAGSVLAALDAQRDFWLADTALAAAIEGSEFSPGGAAARTDATSSSSDTGH